jgi:hypothetical protein
MEITENKNDRQFNFNQIRGIIKEISGSEELYPNLTIEVGHENKRLVNFLFKRVDYKRIVDNYALNSLVIIKFYIASRKKNDRWYTSANILAIELAGKEVAV